MLDTNGETLCPFCNSNQLVVVDIIAAFNGLLPDIFAIDCKNCGRMGQGYQTDGKWQITWDEVATQPVDA
jgi:transcription elongation factor Elf1